MGPRSSCSWAYLSDRRRRTTSSSPRCVCSSSRPMRYSRVGDDAVLTLLSIAGILHARSGQSNRSWTPPGVWISPTLRRCGVAAAGQRSTMARALICGALRAERVEAPRRGRSRRPARSSERGSPWRTPRCLPGAIGFARGAVEHVHLDLARGHELLDVRRAAVEADGHPRRVLEHDVEVEHLAALGVDRLVRDRRRDRPRSSTAAPPSPSRSRTATRRSSTGSSGRCTEAPRCSPRRRDRCRRAG